MKRRNIAIFLLAVIVFHSFVLVPRANAMVFEAALARQAFMAASPYAVGIAVAGMAMKIMIDRGMFTDIIILKSAAITALKDWLGIHVTTWALPPAGTTDAYGVSPNGTSFHVTITWTGGPSGGKYAATGNFYIGPSNGPIYSSYPGAQAYTSDTYQDARDDLFAAGLQKLKDNNWYGYGTGDGHYNTSQQSAPTVPTDYGSVLETNPPSIPAGSVYGSQGAAARVASGAQDYGISVSWLSDAEVGGILDAFGGTAIDPDTGTQDGVAGPTPTDNTITSGASQQIGLLGSILSFVSNLVGIKDSAKSIETSLDNAVPLLQEISGKLDNTSAFPQAAQTALDNIAVGTQIMETKMDNVIEGIQGLSETGTSVGSLSTRFSAIRTLASTKFPFSVVAGLVLTNPAGGHMDLGTFHVGPVTVDIEPLNVPLVGNLLSTARTIFALFLYAGTLFAILRKVDSL